ncbi:ATPase, T2SS/T4P/T4SS family [Aliicoccus persicus]|uniref:Competence protein ComGA/type IV pilus assembly protein PilB n=1 Tax=Aliicoccus persicus TaxID=930138 RepID=A0A662Z3F0_9STAP|nr:ATPase, T2SS/T4P/T4SS family [Aliicoccus persicus]SEV84645.1 competence protein ComGA/type IV pilus assembly protein PilB [Aliicoccus persicus]
MRQNIEKIIVHAKEQHASDIHITLESSYGLVRFRIKGEMVDYDYIKTSEYNKMINYLKFMADLDINEHRIPQSGKTLITHNQESIAVRVSTLPIDMMNEVIVIRLLLSENHLKQLELFHDEKDMMFLQNYVSKSQGLILFTGPTGVGKTTLMYQLLTNEINQSKKQIISIEDPIEYESDHMIQVEINEKTEMNHENILKGALRCDPDILLFGEIRSKEVAESLIKASLSGHLVLSTFHSKSAIATIERLKDYGLFKEEIRQSVSLIINQRLIHTENRSYLIYEHITNDDICQLLDGEYPSYETLNDKVATLYKEKVIDRDVYEKYSKQFQ